MNRFVPERWMATLLILASTWLLILVLQAPTAMSMAGVWNQSETYAHGWVVPPIVLWMMWRQRARVWALSPAPSWSALLPLAAMGLLWLAGEMVAVNTTTHFALVAMLALAVPVVAGWRVARAMVFPLGFLFLAVPAGDFLLPQLMSLTADFTVWALRVSGVPVYREGLQFIIPSGSWSVVEACSGIRYLMASIMAGCLYGYLNYHSAVRRLVFVVFSVLLALLANWLRAYLIVMLGHYSGNALASGVDHLIYGWVFFGLVLALLFWVGSFWAEPDLPASPQPSDMAGDGAPSSVASGQGARIAVAAACLVVLAVPHAMQHAFQQHVVTAPVSLVPTAPAQGWQKTPLPTDWKPSFQGASATGHTAYLGPGGAVVGMHVSYYREQDAQRKLVSSVNTLIGTKDDHWAKVSEDRAQARVADRAVVMSAVTLRALNKGFSADAQRLLTWHVYWVDGHLTASQVEAKLLGAWQLARGRGDDGAIVTVHTQQLPDQPGAAPETLARFLESHGAAILTALNQTRGQD